MFGVCETMLSGNISNEEIFINGFSPDPFRNDKASNIRNGGVCLFYKESLPIKERCDLEIKFNRKKIFIVLSHCHPNMSNNEFAEFTNLLENIDDSIRKENPTVSILCGDFNARPPLFC